MFSEGQGFIALRSRREWKKKERDAEHRGGIWVCIACASCSWSLGVRVRHTHTAWGIRESTAPVQVAGTYPQIEHFELRAVDAKENVEGLEGCGWKKGAEG